MESLQQRKSNRLERYDYGQSGFYFITICTKDMSKLFGIIPYSVGADIIRPQLSAIGEIVKNAIDKISHVYPSVTVDCYIIMPNHIHMILIITNNGRIISAPTTPKIITVPKIVGYFKQYVSRTLGFSPWQKSYHDRIIRDEVEYNRIAQYIENNPINWEKDCFYPTKPEKNQ